MQRPAVEADTKRPAVFNDHDKDARWGAVGGGGGALSHERPLLYFFGGAFPVCFDGRPTESGDVIAHTLLTTETGRLV